MLCSLLSRICVPILLSDFELNGYSMIVIRIKYCFRRVGWNVFSNEELKGSSMIMIKLSVNWILCGVRSEGINRRACGVLASFLKIIYFNQSFLSYLSRIPITVSPWTIINLISFCRATTHPDKFNVNAASVVRPTRVFWTTNAMIKFAVCRRKVLE